MQKLLLAAFVAIASLFASISTSTAAPVLPLTAPYAVADDAIQQSVLPVLPAHLAGPRHNCRRHGICGWAPGYGWGPGYGHGGHYRSCRRVRNRCWRRHGGGRNYRRCVRNRGCRP